MEVAKLILELIDQVGTIAFAVSGAMVAVKKGADLFGVLFLGCITAIGGGTIRDIIIGYVPPRMFSNKMYIILAALSALCVFCLASIFQERYEKNIHLVEQINNVFDALGLGIFAASGAQVAIEAGFQDNLFLMVSLGTTTAIGGGMLRDMMLREIPFVLRKRIYALAAIAGAMAYSLLWRGGMEPYAASCVCIVVTFSIRIAATVFNWNLPRAIRIDRNMNGM